MIPKHVLAQLEEHTSMGFLLFYTDKDGNPKQHFHFDCDIAYHGLASYAKMVLD